MQAFTKFKHSFEVSKQYINFAQTLSCGQIFSYKTTDYGFELLSGNKIAYVVENEKKYKIYTNNTDFFKNFLDLDVNYEKIKEKLSKTKLLKTAINFGDGIRILKQEKLETIISFVISANNNIKRITKTLFALREKYGLKMEGFYAFPTIEELQKITEEQFKAIGCGYRSVQLVKLIKQLSEQNFEGWEEFNTKQLKEKLISLSGIGPKVADCIMLFSYNKTDVFPVDTWIAKVYNQYFEKCDNRIEIRKRLIDKFGNLSGYAQQYLFFYKRENP